MDMENDRCTNVDSVINPELAPLNIKNALEENDIDTINKRWFSKRCIPEKRDGLESVYKTFGKDWNRQSHFASLTDQYWLGSSMDDRWEDINFFTRRYDRAIGDAFFKSWQVDKLKSDDSPDITTNGLIKKRWLQLDGYTSYLVKAGNPKLQQEPLNEVLATMVLKKLDIIPFVPYEFRVEGFTLCSIANIGGYEPIGPNGEFRKPSTYFGYIIRHAVQSLFNPESLTGHFAHIERQLKKAAAEYGIPYEKEYIRRLAKIADVSYQSALSAFVRSNTTHEEYNGETAEQSEDYGQPEVVAAEKAKREAIRELIDRLPVRERYVVMQVYFNDISIDELVIEMSKVTGESLSKKDVIKIQRSAFNKLEPMLRKQGYGGRCGYFHPVFVRSDEELDEEMMDIANAFDDDAGSTILIKLNLK